jgi:hypothetical protein
LTDNSGFVMQHPAVPSKLISQTQRARDYNIPPAIFAAV